jgi:hypothetical protein
MPLLRVRIEVSNFLPESGPVAQLGARFHGMEEVVGSIPTRSTNSAYTSTKSGKRLRQCNQLFAELLIH